MVRAMAQAVIRRPFTAEYRLTLWHLTTPVWVVPPDAAHSPIFFSSKCRLFHNATFFGSCIIHILNTGRAKI
jgi:hypothetical protein